MNHKRPKGRKKRRQGVSRTWAVFKGLSHVGDWISSRGPTRNRITYQPTPDTGKSRPQKAKPRSFDPAKGEIKI